ncbi:MAG: winged helix-turn-helix transcriptional regulator [Bacteroidota bacterium]
MTNTTDSEVTTPGTGGKLSPRCPIRTTLEMLGGKWRLLIINAIGDEAVRFGELKRRVPDISEKMLAQELKALADNQLIIRTNYGEVPPRVDYRLTPLGHQARALIGPMVAFGLQCEAGLAT